MTKGSSEDDFLKTLEAGVRKVLRDPDSKPSERVAAIAAGSKLLMIRYRISDSEESTFFR